MLPLAFINNVISESPYTNYEFLLFFHQEACLVKLVHSKWKYRGLSMCQNCSRCLRQWTKSVWDSEKKTKIPYILRGQEEGGEIFRWGSQGKTHWGSNIWTDLKEMRELATWYFWKRVPGKREQLVQRPQHWKQVGVFKKQLGGQCGWSRMRNIESGKRWYLRGDMGVVVRGIKKPHFSTLLWSLLSQASSIWILSRVPQSSMSLWLCDRGNTICAHPAPALSSHPKREAGVGRRLGVLATRPQTWEHELMGYLSEAWEGLDHM